MSSFQRRSSSCLRVFVFDCPFAFHRTNVYFTSNHVLNKHKVTKTLSNFLWCKDTKVLTGESLCLQFSGVALRAFVSLCLIVHLLFIAPPAPEASRRTNVYFTANHVLNKHKVTKTLSNFPWCKDTKVLTGESLCLQFGGVALRAFVSLCLIVHWFFIAPPAPEASRRTNVKLIQFFNKLLERCASYV